MFSFRRSCKSAVPKGLHDKVRILGRSDLRFFAEDSNPALIEEMISLIKKDLSAYNVLAVSGGAGDGAYGAGIMKGWATHGSRPVFRAVSGISTGALIAPLAFLGPEYDHILEWFYTNTSGRDILRYKGPMRVIFGNSFTSNRPLERIIRKIVDRDFLRRIGDEFQKGRKLLIGTADFDSQRLAVWDMGKIAAIGDKDAMDLFCRIVLASTAIPVVFPPVFIDVEADGKRYKEMHLDGGTLTQVFFLYRAVRGIADEAARQGMDVSKIKVNLYVILNGYLAPRWKAVGDNLPSIFQRYLDTMSVAQNRGDLARLFLFAKQLGHDFNMAYIPPSFEPCTDAEFDKTNMNRLFELGRGQAESGYPWMKDMLSV